ncbi:MAG: hypothetical protein ABF868_07160 [Sporolactobacillus sp.]
MDALRRIGKRFKQYMWVVLALMLVLGATGWFLPFGKSLSRYQASATIWLGDYDNSSYNDTDNVQIMLNNLPFYKQYLPDLTTNVANFAADLSVTALRKTMIQVSYTGRTQQAAAETANRIAAQFLKLDHRAYEQREQMLAQVATQLETLQRTAPSADGARMLYQLRSQQMTDKPAQLLQAAQVSGARGSSVFSAKKRALLGVLLGFTIAFFGFAFPELVAGDSRRKGDEHK